MLLFKIPFFLLAIIDCVGEANAQYLGKLTKLFPKDKNHASKTSPGSLNFGD